MDEIRVPRRQLTDPIIFPTGEAQLIVVERACVHVLDIEDTHFAHDRSILLPDIARVDGSEPTLDDRRITGLGVIYAALIHADRHPDQKVLVVGHTDPSGPASYNQTLSEKRAENVQLFLTGDREGWRQQSNDEDHSDDVQRILKFQATRAGWDCDPGPVTGTMNFATRQAVGRFQERYNVEVDRTASEGLDLPYKARIGVDNDVGPETWGAFFDIYCHEVMRLLGTESFSELEAKTGAISGFDALPASVGCGENIPFESGRREPFDPDEELDRPQRNPSDRRVEIMFFDPVEEPDLVCHAGGGCDPSACPLYTTDEYCHREIGVPRGLQIGEVVMDLRFEDPEGRTHPLPPGVEVEVRFDDESSETHVLTDDGRVSFVTARDKSSFDLALTTEDGRYLALVPGTGGASATTELLDRDEALEKMGDGARFFRLPEAFDTHDADWRVPSDVAFVDGRFINLDNPSTRIGTRASPARVVLVPVWQHFRFDYFDRWRSETTSVPQPRPRQDDTLPLLLEGHLAHVDYANGPTDPPAAESVWDVEASGQTVHCVAWVLRRPSAETPPRELPDTDCLTRFVFPEGTFLRTEGAPDAATPERILETIADGHDHFEEVTTAGVPRLRYYDLPTQWWSRGYFARRASEAATARRPFAQVTDPSTAADPFVIDLDDIVLCLHGAADPFGGPGGPRPMHQYSWNDTDDDRFTIWDQELSVHKPHSADTYLTDVAQLSPTPTGAVVLDHAPITRLVTRGREIFHVFDERTQQNSNFEDHPIGARIGHSRRNDVESPFFSLGENYDSPRADDTRPPHSNVGDIPTMVLRCCGHEEDREIFRVAQYAAAFFDFAPTSPTRGTAITPPVPAATALAEIRRSLRDSASRWNGTDATNGARTVFEVGPADNLTARGFFHALLVRGSDAGPLTQYYTISIVGDARAHMARVCTWERTDMQNITSGDDAGTFTAAHEWGHAFGNPDHYIERSRNASLFTHGIRDRFRSPGCPYNFDSNGMMNGSEKRPRGYDFWHLALWMVETDHSFSGETDIAVKQGQFRYTTTVTARDQSRARNPAISKPNFAAGAQGLCDVLAYCGGVDGFNGGDALHGATLTEPWDMVVIVRVKMAVTLQEDDHKPYNGGRLFLRQVQGIIHRIFNRERRLLARGTFEGRSIRARILFSPRFVVRTFPTGSSTDRTDYITGLRLTATTSAAYTTKVSDLVTESGVHCEVIAVEDPDDHGITNGTATPRRANLDTDDVEDEIVEIFGKLIGLTDPDEDDEPNQYAPLANALAPDFVRSSLEFIE